MLFLIITIINYFLSITVSFKTRFLGFCGTLNVKEKYFPFFKAKLAIFPWEQDLEVISGTSMEELTYCSVVREQIKH